MEENTFKQVIIDFDLLKKHDISVNEFITLVTIDFASKDIPMNYEDHYIDYLNLTDKRLIKVIQRENTTEYILRTKAKLIVKSSLRDIQVIEEEDGEGTPTKRSDRELTNIIEKGVDQFREEFRGFKPGSMGSKNNCKNKLRRWMIDNPEHPFENIIKAVKIYINSLNNQYTYLQQADYFIYKRENGSKEESSRLSAFIEEVSDAEVISGGWTSTLS